MQLTKLVLAILPAVALAQDSATASVTSVASGTATESAETHTTHTSTKKLVKTITLSQVSTITSTYANSTSYMPTGGMTSIWTPPGSATTTPATVPTPEPTNAGSALDATKVVLAGVAGMLVVAMM